MDIQEKVQLQRDFFNTHKTYSIEFRRQALIKLKDLLIKYRPQFDEAFKKDYNKCKFDVLTTELMIVLEECKYMIKHLKKLTKTRRVHTSLLNFPSHGYLMQEPYGVCLVMAPWNYPLQLTLDPVFGAIAAGNTVVLKPASYTKKVSSVINKLIEEFNNPGLLACVEGGREQNQALLDQRFDYIFFTGGETVGRLVLEKASVHLTPVVLELGGKSPCIVNSDADIDLAARRVVWGKYLNAGQTCVAPDYICVHKSIHDKFVSAVIKYIQKFYYSNGKISDDFPHLINEKHFNKVTSFIDKEKVIFGGQSEGLLLHPTVLDHVTFEDKVMSEEIFGPIMPVIEFDDLTKLLEKINSMPKPLAFYFFSKNKRLAKRVLLNSPFGGSCINDTIMHLTNEKLPFGGVGRSGMGAYHGKKSFETFSHQKSVLCKGKLELMLKYPPYSEKKYRLVEIYARLKKVKK